MGAIGQSAVTPERITQMGWGFTATLMMDAAIRNGVFDALDSAPKTIEETAHATGASVRGLRAVMEALAGHGLLTRGSGGKYGLASDAAAFLVKGRPGYMGELVKHFTSDLFPKWANLAEVVRVGRPMQPVNDETSGTAFFEHFVEGLFPMNYPAASALADSLVREGVAPRKALDLAAGSGVWGIALAQKFPDLKVIAVDWAQVLNVTRKVAERNGLADRFSYIAGDLEQADFGKGYDVALLGHILHSQGEKLSRSLLKKTHSALERGGRIAIAEFLVSEDRSGPPMGLTFAVNMLVATEEGDAFSFPQIATWLHETGFEDARLAEVPGPASVIVARKK